MCAAVVQDCGDSAALLDDVGFAWLTLRGARRLLDNGPAWKRGEANLLSGGSGMGRKKILVVEDNLDNRRILVYRLRRIGDFQIIEASNGQEALGVVETETPDLIFMDLKMPVMDGWEATRRIRASQAGQRIPIIALTAQAMAGDEQKALAAGCDDYVAKPIVDPGVVRQKLERLLEKGRSGVKS